MSASQPPTKIMALSSEFSSGTSNTEFYLNHIGAWCNLPLENEYATSLKLFNASSTSPDHQSTRSSTSTKSANPKSKPSSTTSKANTHLHPTEALHNTILEPRQVDSQQVSNHYAATPSSQIEDNKTTYASKSENWLDGYYYGHPTHSTMAQKWLDEGHEEGPLVWIKGTQEASHRYGVDPCSCNG